MGRNGREAVTKHVPALRKSHQLDAVIVNGDNAAAGFGITPDICRTWLENGVDVVTGGDHIWDQKEILPFISMEKRLLRPHNFPRNNPGSGIGCYTLHNGQKLVVLHLLGQVFIKDNVNCPFTAAGDALAEYRLGQNADAIFVDFHAEATSEKNAMGHHLNGKVSAVIGSHTHVPTRDARVFPGGTAYLSDAGMCGDYHSVIGFDKDAPLERFTTKMSKNRLQPASGHSRLCGAIVETDKKGLAQKIEYFDLEA